MSNTSLNHFGAISDSCELGSSGPCVAKLLFQFQTEATGQVHLVTPSSTIEIVSGNFYSDLNLKGNLSDLRSIISLSDSPFMYDSTRNASSGSLFFPAVKNEPANSVINLRSSAHLFPSGQEMVTLCAWIFPMDDDLDREQVLSSPGVVAMHDAMSEEDRNQLLPLRSVVGFGNFLEIRNLRLVRRGTSIMFGGGGGGGSAEHFFAKYSSLDATAHGVINEREWSHVCGMYNSTHVSVWVNGEELDSRCRYIDVLQGEAMIGGFVTEDGITDLWRGMMADVRVYFGALNAAQIQRLGQGLPALYEQDGFTPLPPVFLRPGWSPFQFSEVDSLILFAILSFDVLVGLILLVTCCHRCRLEIKYWKSYGSWIHLPNGADDEDIGDELSVDEVNFFLDRVKKTAKEVVLQDSLNEIKDRVLEDNNTCDMDDVPLQNLAEAMFAAEEDSLNGAQPKDFLGKGGLDSDLLTSVDSSRNIEHEHEKLCSPPRISSEHMGRRAGKHISKSSSPRMPKSPREKQPKVVDPVSKVPKKGTDTTEDEYFEVMSLSHAISRRKRRT